MIVRRKPLGADIACDQSSYPYTPDAERSHLVQVLLEDNAIARSRFRIQSIDCCVQLCRVRYDRLAAACDAIARLEAGGAARQYACAGTSRVIERKRGITFQNGVPQPGPERMRPAWRHHAALDDEMHDGFGGQEGVRHDAAEQVIFVMNAELVSLLLDQCFAGHEVQPAGMIAQRVVLAPIFVVEKASQTRSDPRARDAVMALRLIRLARIVHNRFARHAVFPWRTSLQQH